MPLKKSNACQLNVILNYNAVQCTFTMYWGILIMIAKLSDNFYTHPFPRLHFSIKTRMVNSTRLSFSDGSLLEPVHTYVKTSGYQHSPSSYIGSSSSSVGARERKVSIKVKTVLLLRKLKKEVWNIININLLHSKTSPSIQSIHLTTFEDTDKFCIVMLSA